VCRSAQLFPRTGPGTGITGVAETTAPFSPSAGIPLSAPGVDQAMTGVTQLTRQAYHKGTRTRRIENAIHCTSPDQRLLIYPYPTTRPVIRQIEARAGFRSRRTGLCPRQVWDPAAPRRAMKMPKSASRATASSCPTVCCPRQVCDPAAPQQWGAPRPCSASNTQGRDRSDTSLERFGNLGQGCYNCRL